MPSGLHDTLLLMSSKTRSIFQQRRECKARARPSVKNGLKATKAASAQASGKISGSVLGSVTGVEMRHLLLLLPFFLFDLLDDEIHNHNEKNEGFELINPVHELIKSFCFARMVSSVQVRLKKGTCVMIH